MQYRKCNECKWLIGDKKTVGIRCMNPCKQDKWKTRLSMYKQPTGRACKSFEEK